MIKMNNNVSVRLSDQEISYLMNLMNDKFEIDSLSDAIRYCIRKQQNDSQKMYTTN